MPKQRSTKYYTENQRSITRILLKTRGKLSFPRKGKQFLLHQWYPSCYSSDKSGDKSLMRKGQQRRKVKWCKKQENHKKTSVFYLKPQQQKRVFLLRFVLANKKVDNTVCCLRASIAVIVWQLNLHLPMQSVPITTEVVSSNLDQGEVYNIL